jgi:hypothetical protein
MAMAAKLEASAPTGEVVASLTLPGRLEADDVIEVRRHLASLSGNPPSTPQILKRATRFSLSRVHTAQPLPVL